MKLWSLKCGQTGRITKMEGLGLFKRRLMDMGVLVGEPVRMERVAPLGDPIEVTVKSYRLSLRKKEADGITVEAME